VAMGFQQLKDKLKSKSKLPEVAKESMKLSRNTKKPLTKINKIMNIEIKEKNFKQMKGVHLRNGSSDSTAMSSQNSKGSPTIRFPCISLKSISPKSNSNRMKGVN
jgi:hypothetical protein